MTEKPSPPIVNVFTGENVRQESQCPEPNDWKEWGGFAWCRSVAWLNSERIVAIFTAIVGIATWLLWRATRDLVKGAERTAEQQLRAYVSAQVNFFYAFDDARFARARFQIENAGVTPAYSLMHHADIVVAPEPLGNYVFPAVTRPLSNPITVFPKLLFNGHVGASARFTKEDITKIIATEAKLYVYGHLSYKDAFGRLRTTDFCVSVEADKTTLEKLCTNYEPSDLVLNFRAGPIGNHAT